MRFHYLILFCLSFETTLHAQNLIANGSFEEYYHCPDNASQLDSCIGWMSVMYSPDYYNICASYPVSVPNNFCGFQFPFSGDAYVGLVSFAWAFTNAREIIGTQLVDTLVPGQSYRVSMRVSRGNHTSQANNNAASNRIGLRFTTQKFSQDNPPPIDNFAQLHEDSIITDTLNWVFLVWHFIADSAYTNIYIGNFFDDAHTDTITYGPYPADAYYFIDSVNIFCEGKDCISSTGDADTDVPLVLIGNNNELIATQNGQLQLYNLCGQLVLNVHVIEGITFLPSISAGMYLMIFSGRNFRTAEKIILPSP